MESVGTTPSLLGGAVIGAQLPPYVSLYLDPTHFRAVDAMSREGSGMDAQGFFFLPWTMSGEVWAGPPWTRRPNSGSSMGAQQDVVPLLLQLLIDTPVHLPQAPDLIRMPHYTDVPMIRCILWTCTLVSYPPISPGSSFQTQCPVETRPGNHLGDL